MYCRSGARAGVAIQLLLDSGFNGTIYNGQGVSQWQREGYPLVTTPSALPRCSAMQGGTKRQAAQPCELEDETTVPTSAPVADGASGMPSLEQAGVEAMDTAVPSSAPTEEPTSGTVSLWSCGMSLAVVSASLLVCLF